MYIVKLDKDLYLSNSSGKSITVDLGQAYKFFDEASAQESMELAKGFRSWPEAEIVVNKIKHLYAIQVNKDNFIGDWISSYPVVNFSYAKLCCNREDADELINDLLMDDRIEEDEMEVVVIGELDDQNVLKRLREMLKVDDNEAIVSQVKKMIADEIYRR